MITETSAVARDPRAVITPSRVMCKRMSLGRFSVLEVATHGVTHLPLQVRQVIALGEDVGADRPCSESPARDLVHDAMDLGHGARPFTRGRPGTQEAAIQAPPTPLPRRNRHHGSARVSDSTSPACQAW